MKRKRSLQSDFANAIRKEDFSLARDIVTYFPVDTGKTKQKARAYMTLMRSALKAGKLSVALEVRPFCGHIFQKAELRNCLKEAIKKGLIEECLLCKKYLCKHFTLGEIVELELAVMKKADSTAVYPFTMIKPITAKDPLALSLSRIICDNVDIEGLSIEDQLLLNLMNIVR